MKQILLLQISYADYRAPTPSAAAEIAVKNLKELNNEIST